MPVFINFRNRIRSIITTYEVATQRIATGIFSFFCLMLINKGFGYSDVLQQIWLVIGLTVLCAFLPLSGVALVFAVFLLINLGALSTDVAIMALLLIVASYLICGFYGVSRSRNIIFVGVFQQINIPYLVPMETGLMGGLNDIASVICGSVIAFYLRAVRENSASFLDESTSISSTDIVMNQMLGNYMFYFYMVAMILMFIVIYNIKSRENINNAWLIATAAGTLTELVIMLAGYLFTDNTKKLPELLIGNLVVFLLGLAINYIFRDLDYSRVERVQFEDEDYYYYVTAVPKIRIAEEHRQVKKITNNPVRKKETEADKEN